MRKNSASSNSSSSIGDPWYTIAGPEQDVVVSTRMRLSRNLANFPFPPQLEVNDAQRILSIVIDAFNHLENGDQYQSVLVDNMDSVGIKIMEERGILNPLEQNKSAILIRNDGKFSCTVNTIDHVRLSSIFSGFDFDNTFTTVKTVDDQLQKVIQFAASYDFGYLNTSILDCGSGMKLSVRLHLPALSFLNKIQFIASDMAAKGFNFTATYGSGVSDSVSDINVTGASLGEFYDLSTKHSSEGTEFDQIAAISSECKKLVDSERKAREEIKKTMASSVKNFMYRAVYLARSSVFINRREAIEIISGVKLGKDLKLLTGINDSELCALLLRIQDGHLSYVMKSEKFKIEKDIENDDAKKIELLRAILLQEAFEDINLSL